MRDWDCAWIDCEACIAKPRNYATYKNVTKHQEPCERWSGLPAKSHWRGYLGGRLLSLPGAFCANPDRDVGGPWCITQRNGKGYDYCFNDCDGVRHVAM